MKLPSFLRASLGILAGAVLLGGCSKDPGTAEKTASGKTKVKVGYMGLTCEAPIYVAKEKGYFDEQGIEVELVKVEWTQFKDVLGLGGVHVGHQPIMAFLKPIAEGLDVKMTAGVHKGCLRVQTAANNDKLNHPKDLRGKRIGVPGMGTPPFIFANRVLGLHGIDPRTEIEWKVFTSSELGLALEKGEVDAIANSEPVGLLLLAEGKVKNLADQTRDAPFAEEYCCGIVVNGKFTEKNPEAIAAATKAILKGGKWVEANPRAAARMSVEKGYILSNPELNTQALSALRYIPSVAGGKEAIVTAATSMKSVGIIDPNTDVQKTLDHVYAPLPGLTDEWLKTVEVEKEEYGQVPPDQWDRMVVELHTIGAPAYVKTCCSAGSASKKEATVEN